MKKKKTNVKDCRAGPTAQSKQTDLKMETAAQIQCCIIKVFSYGRLKVSNMYFKVKWPQANSFRACFKNHPFSCC